MNPAHYAAIFFLALLFQNPAFSQSQATIGTTAGINMSAVHFETNDEASTDNYLGYYGGLRAQFPIKGKFSVVSNLLYSRKGWHFDPYLPTQEPGGTMHLDYLDLQLSGQYAITKSLAVDAGVEVGRLLKTTRDPSAGDFLDDLYQKGDFSLLIGASYKILQSIRLEARYLHGISYLYKGNFTDINGNDLGEVKDGNFGVFQIGLSADIIKLKSTEKKKV